MKTQIRETTIQPTADGGLLVSLILSDKVPIEEASLHIAVTAHIQQRVKHPKLATMQSAALDAAVAELFEATKALYSGPGD